MGSGKPKLSQAAPGSCHLAILASIDDPHLHLALIVSLPKNTLRTIAPGSPLESTGLQVENTELCAVIARLRGGMRRFTSTRPRFMLNGPGVALNKLNYVGFSLRARRGKLHYTRSSLHFATPPEQINSAAGLVRVVKRQTRWLERLIRLYVLLPKDDEPGNLSLHEV